MKTVPEAVRTVKDPLIPPPEDDPAFEPDPEDRAWLAPLDLADQALGWEEYRLWAERVEAAHCGLLIRSPLCDLDILIATGTVG